MLTVYLIWLQLV